MGTPGSPTAMAWATTAMDTPAPTDTMADGTARGLLRPRPSPRLMPTPTCCTEDTVWDTTATGPTATPTLTDTTARGPLRPRPRLTPWLTYGYGLGHHYGYAGPLCLQPLRIL